MSGFHVCKEANNSLYCGKSEGDVYNITIFDVIFDYIWIRCQKLLIHVVFFILVFGCTVLHNTPECYSVFILRWYVIWTYYRVLVLLSIPKMKNKCKNFPFWCADEL